MSSPESQKSSRTSHAAVTAFHNTATWMLGLSPTDRRRLLLALTALFDVDFGSELDDETALGAIDLETSPAPKEVPGGE